MRKNKNTNPHSFGANKNNQSFLKLLKSIFAVKGILNFDILSLSSNFHEKLPIIYANIRV